MLPSLSILFLIATQAAPAGWADAIPGDPRLVLGRWVRAELRITQEEADQIRAALKEIDEARLQAGKALQENLSPLENRKAVAGLYASSTRAGDDIVAKVIGKDRTVRYKQICIQAKGVYAFRTPVIIAVLKLDERQSVAAEQMARSTLAQVRAVDAEFIKAHPRPTEKDQESLNQMRAKIRQLEAEGVARCLELLNDDQKKLWAEMTGAPFRI